MASFAIPAYGHGRDPGAQKRVQLEFIQDYVEEAAAKESLEPALLRAIIRVESNFNHRAVSPVGARGLMQLMPDTAGHIGTSRALYNPRANILAGAHYLRNMINQFQGNLKVALAAYNAGPKAVEKYRGIPPFPETRSYVSKVLRQLKVERKFIAAKLGQ
jgi:soluble lytic murein transglycosylase-like protein